MLDKSRSMTYPSKRCQVCWQHVHVLCNEALSLVHDVLGVVPHNERVAALLDAAQSKVGVPPQSSFELGHKASVVRVKATGLLQQREDANWLALNQSVAIQRPV